MKFENIINLLNFLDNAEPSYKLTCQKDSIRNFLDKLENIDLSDYNVLLINF